MSSSVDSGASKKKTRWRPWSKVMTYTGDSSQNNANLTNVQLTNTRRNKWRREQKPSVFAPFLDIFKRRNEISLRVRQYYLRHIPKSL